MITDRQLSAYQRRTLRTMREKLLTMAEIWDGRDQYLLTCLTEAADSIEKAALELTEDPPWSEA